VLEWSINTFHLRSHKDGRCEASLLFGSHSTNMTIKAAVVILLFFFFTQCVFLPQRKTKMMVNAEAFLARLLCHRNVALNQTADRQRNAPE